MNLEKNSQSKPATNPRKKFLKFLKIFAVVVLFLIIAGLIANWIWIRSGSNKWEPAINRDGVVVHKLKVPGSFVLQLKATKRMKTTLEALISAMQDVDAMCTDGCAEARIVERVDSPDKQIVYTYSIFDMPFPLIDREWVLENKFSQDSLTKEIIYKIDAVPYIVPPKKGYVRINHFNNKWRFIPLGNGEVDVEWYINMSYGGYLADLFHNLFIPNIMPESLHEIEEIIKNEKYKNAKFDFVKEADSVNE
jgi:hypothetical protein